MSPAIAEILALAAMAFVSYLIGRFGLDLLGFGVDSVLRFACPLVGAAAMAFELWLFGALHLPWTLPVLLAPWAIAAVIGWRVSRRVVAEDLAGLAAWRTGQGLDPLSLGLLAAVLLTLGMYLLTLVTQPLSAWDALAMWVFKAKVFFEAGAVDLSRFDPHLVTVATDRHFDYPPLYSLIVDVTWVFVGHVDEALAKAVNLVFLVSAAGAVMSVVWRCAGPRVAAAVGLVCVATPVLQPVFVLPTEVAYADFPLAALMTVSLSLVFISPRLGRDHTSALALFFAMLAGLTKNEGVPFFVFIALVLGGATLLASRHERRVPLAAVVALVPILVPLLAWQLYVKGHGFDSDVVSQLRLGDVLPTLPERVKATIRFVAKMPSRQNDYAWVGVAFVMAPCLVAARRNWRVALIYCVILAQTATLVLALLTTARGIQFELITFADRLILQVTPALLLVIGISLARTEAPLLAGPGASQS